MSKLRVVITFLFLLFAQIVFSQINGDKQFNISFKSGEKVTYRAVYNWGFIWINAADVIFTVRDTIYNNRPSIHFKSVGWSLKQYDWFYKVRDRFESIVSESLRPYWFERESYEGGYKAYNQYQYNYKDNTLKIVSQTSERPYKQELLTLRPGAFDVLSAIYYCRCINFNSLKVEEKIPLTMIIDNEIFDLYIRYLGKETLTAHDGKIYQTIKFSVKLVEGTIFKGGEDLNVWVIDDQFRIPVLIEAKILIGSIKAVLVSAEGLR